MKQLYENELYTRPYFMVRSTEAFQLHYHRHLEILHIVEGSITVQLSDNSYLLGKGDTVFISPYELHGYKVPKSLPITCKALMESECLGLIGDLICDSKPKNPVISASLLEGAFPNATERLIRLTERLNDSSDKERFVKDYASCYGELVDFISAFFSVSGIEGGASEAESLYLKAVRICYDSCTDKDFNASVLAQRLYISRSRLQQLFSKHLQLGVKEYITLLRMSRAESLLRETDININHIADVCGYNNSRSFNRSFLSTHSITPSEYRSTFGADTSQEINRKILSNKERFYKKDGSSIV